jgi:hypothetical protein
LPLKVIVSDSTSGGALIGIDATAERTLQPCVVKRLVHNLGRFVGERYSSGNSSENTDSSNNARKTVKTLTIAQANNLGHFLQSACVVGVAHRSDMMCQALPSLMNLALRVRKRGEDEKRAVLGAENDGSVGSEVGIEEFRKNFAGIS